jgi:hypothetical protein
MSTAPDALVAPPIDALVSELIATLAIAADAYLEPKDGPPDIEAAVLACDVAGFAFERKSQRLRAEERVALSSLLTHLRLAIVKKRGA